MVRSVHYTAIGDSLTEGYGVPAGSGFVDLYALTAERALSEPVRLDNWGVTGATTEEIARKLRDTPEMAENVAAADLITITAGGNDLLGAARLYYTDQDTQHLVQAIKKYQHHLDRLIKNVRRLKHASSKPYAIRLLGLYNPLPLFQEAVFWVDRFNRQMKKHQSSDLVFIDLFDEFSGREAELLSDDIFHPNEEGYRLMAERTAAAGWHPLA